MKAPAKEGLSVNATEGTCTWTIPNFSSLMVIEGKKISNIFSIGGHKWKLFVYPRGHVSSKDKSVSLFLQLADDWEKMLEDGKVTAEYFSLSVICQHDPEKRRKRGLVNHEFKQKRNNRGFPDLISLTDFQDAAKGFLVNDTVTFQVEMKVAEDYLGWY